MGTAVSAGWPGLGCLLLGLLVRSFGTLASWCLLAGCLTGVIQRTDRLRGADKDLTDPRGEAVHRRRRSRVDPSFGWVGSAPAPVRIPPTRSSGRSAPWRAGVASTSTGTSRQDGADANPDRAHACDRPCRVSAYAVAIALAMAHRPELVQDDQIDVPQARELQRIASTGGGILLDLILGFAGEGPVDLYRLDALDLPNRAMVADAMRHL